MLDRIIGALMIGTWMNSMLYMLEITQVVRYFQTFPKDTVGLKIVVALLFIIDTTATLCQYIGVYLYAVTHFGDFVYASASYWPIPVYLISSGIGGFIVQTFLTYRFWVLSRIITLAILFELVILTMLAGATASAVMVARTSSYSDRGIVRIPVMLWLVSSAFGDGIIALGLIWRLRNVKTPFADTASVIKRLTYTTIQTGSSTAIIAIIVLALYLHQPGDNVCTAIGWCLGRVYTLTLVHNLNTRTRFREGGSSGQKGSSRPETVGMDIFHSTSGIQVAHAHVVHVDDGEEILPKKKDEEDESVGPDSTHKNDYETSSAYNGSNTVCLPRRDA
ncbi:hypothetical protein VKT23_000467 [Stygiomarasmius scandens]|uniref:DUF6534 domain-containing protein n=1 Tax=Marasmiellus scandens TaxID=2682957 RepID=A0ABR1K464_9AGAR